MTQRDPQEIAAELQTLDQAHIQNEAARDAFVGLGHTALFAASVSFAGALSELSTAALRPALIGSWFLNVVVLLALTFSFIGARGAIDGRRAAIYDPAPQTSPKADWLNLTSLITFALSLILVFGFVTANVVKSYDEEIASATSTASSATSSNSERGNPTRTGANQPGIGRDTPSSRAVPSPIPSPFATPVLDTEQLAESKN